MPKRLETPEEIQKAWERKREQNRKAQAKWVEANHDEHLKRMKELYQRKKEQQTEKESKKTSKKSKKVLELNLN